MTKLDNLISVVTLLEGEVDVQSYLSELHRHLNEHFQDYEILVIDRNLPDAVAIEVQKQLAIIPCMRYLKLAMLVDEDVALAAGLENAIGDFIVLHSPEEDPVACIIDVVRLSMDGFDIVIGVAPQNQSPGYRIVRPMIQWLLRKIGYNVPRNASGLRCLSRRAVNAVTRTGRFHHQFYVRINNTGYPGTVYRYERVNPDAGRRGLRDGIVQGLHLLVFNSTRPLRWMSTLGVFGSLMAFVFSAYSLIVHYFKETVAEGWTTMVLFSSFLFMIMFIILAFLGEYLGRLLDERNDLDDYTVALERTSSVMLEEGRENVIQD